ncbi:hypothetical protein CCH79_00003142 [Gambusia affinis]|uniref:Uncharacterized protein n=1 Tax=Gambusia affinis TaxID=33528 RepID=A0A315VQG1_GAMAF|nr:hypothetical protein CCH79_00003142 [Gambusia affinis]
MSRRCPDPRYSLCLLQSNRSNAAELNYVGKRDLFFSSCGRQRPLPVVRVASGEEPQIYRTSSIPEVKTLRADRHLLTAV